MTNKLQLLEEANRLFKETDLSNVLLIASQHLLGAQKTMFEYLLKKGLLASNVYLIGKCYSTNDKVLHEFKEIGFHVSSNSNKFDKNKSFDKQFGRYTLEMIKDILKSVSLNNFDKVIILEDGGELISHANKLFSHFENIVGIEQTSAGLRKVSALNLKFPVINVARSDTKLRLESPIIADICIEKMNFQLKNLKINPEKVLIIGSGAVGQGIYKIIKDKYDVKRFDSNSLKSDYKKENLGEIIGGFDLIIGSTGEQVFTKEHFKKLKEDCVLVSVSSSDREFNSIDFDLNGRDSNNCHKNLRGARGILLNSGFPVNFDGKRDSVLPEKIQITLSLLFSAVCLAKEEKQRIGINNLSKEIQEELSSKFRLNQKIT